MSRAKMRDALLEFSKREKLPKMVKGATKRANAQERANKADILIGFNNSRVESKKRQKSAGLRFTMNKVRGGATTKEQLDFVLKQELERMQRENDALQAIKAICS